MVARQTQARTGGRPLLAALAGACVLLGGCVAPEEPSPRRAAAPAAAPAPARAGLEDAPIPNRRVRDTSESLIRIQK